MQPYSDYEIAQRRIAERQRKKSQFRTALVFTIIPLFVAMLDSNTGRCLIPFTVIAGILAIVNGIEWYYSSPNHGPSETELEQEMYWLYGEDWQNQPNAQAHALAEDRIRKRKISKWRLAGHALLFFPANGWLFISGLTTKNGDQLGFLLIIITWTVAFVIHAESAFPNQETLKKRESSFGNQILSELGNLQPEKTKPKEKLKRGKYYIVGDDGELEEVDDDALVVEEKPKREMGHDG